MFYQSISAPVCLLEDKSNGLWPDDLDHLVVKNYQTCSRTNIILI